jgi:hypothetical protein
MNLNRLFRTITCFLCLLTLLMPLHGFAEDTVTPKPPVALQLQTEEAKIDRFNQAIEGLAQPFDAGFDAGLLIPILAILCIFGGPVIIVTLLVVRHYRAQERLIEFRRDSVGKLIDAGKDVPESLLFFDNPTNGSEKDLSRGIKNIGLGLGIGIFFTAVIGITAGSVGLILVGLGSAQLLSWKLTRNIK